MLDKRKTNLFFSSQEAQKRLSQYLSSGSCYPLDIVLHPTTACNHHCTFCYNHLNSGDKTESLDSEDVVKWISEFSRMGVKNLIISGGGEPLLHSGIEKILESAGDPALDCTIYTNLDFDLSPKLVKTLGDLTGVRVNINTTHPGAYALTRGKSANLPRVLHNLEVLADRGNVNATVIVRDDTIIYLEETLQVLNNKGIKAVVSPAFQMDYKDGITFGKGLDELNRIKGIFPDNTILEPEPSSIRDSNQKVFCEIPHFDVTIGADYKLYPCCNVAYRKGFEIADLKKYNSFLEAWNSESRKETLRNMPFDKCHKCWFAPANRVILEGKK